MGIPQPPETFGGNLYSNIIREAMGRLNREEMEIEGEEENSTESSSEGTNSAESQSSATSSSSLRFSDGRAFDEIADEVIQRMQEDEREAVSGETQELREPEEILAGEENGGPQEDLVREILDLTETGEEEAIASGDWRTHMENTMNQLVVENAEQVAKLKAQGEQMTKLANLVDGVITWMDRETQLSNQPSPAISATGPIAPQQDVPDTNFAATSRKRTRHSDSHGSQKD